jgi:hypothetical protein
MVVSVALPQDASYATLHIIYFQEAALFATTH